MGLKLIAYAPNGEPVTGQVHTVVSEVFGFERSEAGSYEPRWTGDTDLDTQKPLERDNGNTVWVCAAGLWWDWSQLSFQPDPEDEETPRCPRCSQVLPLDMSKLPHNDQGQAYCTGLCYDKDMRSAGQEPPLGQAECGNCGVFFEPGIGVASSLDDYCSAHCRNRAAGEDCDGPCSYCEDDKVK